MRQMTSLSNKDSTLVSGYSGRKWQPSLPSRSHDPHPVSSLNSSDQVESPPHVDVAVERSGVGDVIFRRRHTQDGLQVARLAEDPPLRRQSVPTERPELRREGGHSVSFLL